MSRSAAGTRTLLALLCMTAVLMQACGGGAEPVDPAVAARNAALVSEAADDPSTLLFTVDPAVNPLAYVRSSMTAPAGELTLVLQNLTAVEHNVVIEGIADDEPIVTTAGRGVGSGVVELAAGEYTFYCDIPGHRSSGMEGQLTVQ